MTLGLTAIGTWIPEARITNLNRLETFNMKESFVREKLGFLELARKPQSLDSSDLCVKAWEDLQQKHPFPAESAECAIVCTQNPDGNGLPHTSAIVHRKLGLPTSCAVFDISLGCSGFTYGLSILQAFMQMHGFRTGVLFTADPYSKVMDENDKKTSTLFGDGAAAALVTDQPVWASGKFVLGSDGTKWDSIIVRNGTLHMNGRAVFTFSVRVVPQSIRTMVQRNGCTLDEVDRLLLHQGSRHIVNAIADELGVPREKCPFYAAEYGNTVSSSVPMALAKEFDNPEVNTLLIAGFGVGLSWASTILRRVR